MRRFLQDSYRKSKGDFTFVCVVIVAIAFVLVAAFFATLLGALAVAGTLVTALVLLVVKWRWAAARFMTYCVSVLLAVGGIAFAVHQGRQYDAQEVTWVGTAMTPGERARLAREEQARQLEKQKNAEHSKVESDLRAYGIGAYQVQFNQKSNPIIVLHDDMVSGTVSMSVEQRSSAHDYPIRKVNGTWQVGCETTIGWLPLRDDYKAETLYEYVSRTGGCPPR